MANSRAVKYILVIKGVGSFDYESIKEDLTKQYEAKEMEPPIFCYLPGEYPELEVIWIDEEMEKHHFSMTVNSQARDVASDFRAMNLMAAQ